MYLSFTGFRKRLVLELLQPFHDRRKCQEKCTQSGVSSLTVTFHGDSEVHLLSNLVALSKLKMSIFISIRVLEQGVQRKRPLNNGNEFGKRRVFQSLAKARQVARAFRLKYNVIFVTASSKGSLPFIVIPGIQKESLKLIKLISSQAQNLKVLYMKNEHDEDNPVAYYPRANIKI
ncbi:hypothetical protein BDF20DRAFT_834769 [Mycotypha africana]|uniref:uncharacterized protein n=1 Tax=Mycotypha africana TaxID=64632 RepID=UPI00230026EE|nr:uncharacterized protein BDF20DRAFT_834769 [Mycotypha africana]KAI8982119.1 hypothetical protein BDF20DRAFT_834769 [Mycotypha africana]